MSQLLKSIASAFFVIVFLTAKSFAQVPAPAPAAASGTDSPKQMIKGFLDVLRRDDVEGLLPYLSFAPGTSPSMKLEIAAQFVDLMNSRGVIDLDKASADVDGRQYDGLPPGQDVIGELKIDGETIPLIVEQVNLVKENRKIWRFQKSLMERVPELHESLAGVAYIQHLPSWLLTPQFLDIKAWQWLGLLISLVVSVLLGRVAAYLLMHIGKVISVYFKFAMTGDTLREFLPSLRWVAGVTLFSIFRRFLELHLVARQYLGQAENILIVLAGGFFLSRALHAGIEYYRRQFEVEARPAAMSMLPPIEKGLRALLVVVVLVALLSASGFNVTALLAGLGVGGLAIALAGQKTIENLFGGVSVILDQPVRVGDSGKFGDVQGTIEDIGLRSTRVRTLDQTLVTIPNSEFSTMKLENYERRSKMRWAVRLGLRYDSKPEQIQRLLDHLKQMMLDHPKVHNDPARVRFTNFGASSLDIDIFAFINAQEPNEYWRIVEELNFKVLGLVEKEGLGFAFPSTSVYMEPNS